MGMSISLATGLYGLSFGALSVGAGLTVAQTVALSALMFTGGSQFAFVGVISAGGTAMAATAAASLLGIRNAVYGLQMNALLRPHGARKFLQAHVTIDESVATASSQEDPAEQRRGFWTAGIGVWTLWNLFTLLGALAGDAMGDPRAWGLDGAAAAAFLGLLWPRLHAREPIATAAVAAGVTVIVVPAVPPGLPLVIAALVAAGLGWWHHRRAV